MPIKIRGSNYKTPGEFWDDFKKDLKKIPDNFKEWCHDVKNMWSEQWEENKKQLDDFIARDHMKEAEIYFNKIKKDFWDGVEASKKHLTPAEQKEVEEYARKWQEQQMSKFANYLEHREDAKHQVIKVDTERIKKIKAEYEPRIKKAKTEEEKDKLKKELRDKIGNIHSEETSAIQKIDVDTIPWKTEEKAKKIYKKKAKKPELTKIKNYKLGANKRNPLVPIHKVASVPPSYYDDKLPSHRDSQGIFFLRIGDCQFFIPPLFINVTNNTPTQKVPALRQKESLSVKAGYNNREITMTLWFGGLDQINGFEMEGPGGQSYYMDGLRSLIAQFKRAPFVPITNELLNSVYGIYAVTLLSISVSTVPNFPQNLQVSLVLKEFNAQPFIGMPTPALHRMYCWPIFRWYYQQMITDDKGACTRTKLPKIETSNLCGRIRFKLLPDTILNAKKPNKKGGSILNGADKLQFLDNEYIWMEEVPMHYDDFVITNINVGLANIISNIQMAYYQSPTCQYLGSLDTMVTINIQTKSRTVLAEFVKLHNITQEYSRIYKDKILCGYMGIENELVNMFGIETATIESIETSTVEGFPGLFNITLRIISYNKTQKNNESPSALAPHTVLGESINEIGQIGKDKFNFKNPIILDGVLEDMISEMEVYPDLELPHYSQLRQAVKNINEYRSRHGLTPIGITEKDIITPYDKVYDVVVQKAKTVEQGSKRDRIDVIPYPGENAAMKGKYLDILQNKLLQYADNKRGLKTITSKQSSYNNTLQNAVSTFKKNLGLGASGRLSRVAWNAVVNVNWNVSEQFPQNYQVIGTPRYKSGGEISRVQSALVKLGYLKEGSYKVSNYDSATRSAVIKFQTNSGFLEPDGLVGVNTWGEIFVRLKQLTKKIPEVTKEKVKEDSFYVDPDFYVFYPSPIALGVVDSKAVGKSLSVLQTGNSTAMLDVNLKNASNPDQASENILNIIRRCSDFSQEYGVQVSKIIDNYSDMPKIDPDSYYKMMVRDMYAYNKRYTLTRAFPTTLFLFVDEGQRVRGVRLWSNMYAYHAIVSVSVTNDIDTAASTCELVLANMYHTLNTNPSYAPVEKKGLFEQQFLSVDSKMLDARKRIYEHMALSPGCRIHIRMGYGSAPQGLPIVFNGVISEMDAGDIMTIIGQGDGVEMCNVMSNYGTEDTNGTFEQGSEPSNIIRTILTARTDFQAAFVWDNNVARHGASLLGIDNDIRISETGKFTNYLGFSNGSKYGIEHFGYVFTDDDQSWLEKNFKALFHVGDQGRWCYDICKNIYKGHPFYDEEGKYEKTTNINDDSMFSFDEKNVYMYLYGKSPWDTFKTLAGCSSEFIATTSPHNFRSTLFFGQPHWLYKYGYRYIGGNSLEERKDLRNYYDLVKPFQQAHIVDSLNDIIDNQLIANSDGVVTAVIPTYVEGNSKSDVKTDLLLFADKNIYPEFQKTAYYDTTMMQNLPLWDKLWKPFGFDNARINARTMGLQYLQHSFRNMYKGEIILLGDPAIKPYDFIYLTDSYVKMAGPCQAGRVTHIMSVNDGFITTFKPDLISITKEAGSVNYAKVLSSLQYFCYNAFTAKMMLQTASTLQKAEEVFKIEEERNIAKKIETGRMIADIGAGLIIPTLISFPINIISVVLMGIAWDYIDDFCEWLLNVFTHRNDHGITVIPIYYKDKPLLVGVKGYKELIPFQEDKSLNGEASLLQSKSMDNAAMEQYLNGIQEEYNATTKNQFARINTGIDMFNITSVNKQMIDYSTAYNYGNINGSNGSATDIRNKIISEAWRIVKLCQSSGGARYSQKLDLRGNKVNGIEWYDCSAFARQCYKVAGLNITSTSNEQWNECLSGGDKFTDDKLAKPGDLVFYGNGVTTKHVAIYIGDGKILNASTDSLPANQQIREGAVHNRKDFMGYGRPRCLKEVDAKAGSSSYFGGKVTSTSDYNSLTIKEGGTAKGNNFTSRQDFISKEYKVAQKIGKKYNLWPSLILANAIQESTNGTSSLAKDCNNLFGIKAYKTWNGRHSSKPAPEDKVYYRAYETIGQSMEDFARLLRGSSRYKPIVNANTVENACCFQSTGYCTGTTKDSQLRDIIRKHQLKQYDVGIRTP